jgi:hypothetical protein
MRGPRYQYTDAVFEENSGRCISRAEVAETPFTAFPSAPTAEQVPGRLVVRRIPDLNPKSPDGQGELFDLWRFHAFFTTSTLDSVTADKTHRGHAIIEAVHADLKASALAHRPCLGVVCRELRLADARGDGVQPHQGRRDRLRVGPGQGDHPTIRRKLIAVPARVATSARRATLHLPTAWPWEAAWTQLFTCVCGPPAPATP